MLETSAVNPRDLGGPCAAAWTTMVVFAILSLCLYLPSAYRSCIGGAIGSIPRF